MRRCVGGSMNNKIELTILARQLVANGMAFGEIGPYERLAGKVRYSIDPESSSHLGIVDLEKAVRNANGFVDFSGDFLILRPQALHRSNRRIFFEYCNRGNLRAIQFFNDAPASNDPVSRDQIGNGFLMRRGYLIAWCGWQGDLWPGDGRLTLTVPEAREDGKPITGLVRTEFIVDESGRSSFPLSGRASTRSYPTAHMDSYSATLTRRRYPEDHRQPISPSNWTFSRIEEGAGSVEHSLGHSIVPSDSHIYLPGGFEKGWIYELVYTAQNPLILGLGHLAARDFVSYLKFGKYDNAGCPNPFGKAVEKAYAWGRSQGGRVIREMVHQGFNVDSRKRQVFDGVLPHVSGGGFMSMNHRFSCVTSTAGQQYEEHENIADRFPFSYAVSKDHLSGITDAILKRPDTDPFVIHTQTATEYWQRHGSLVHTDTEGNDLSQPDNVRLYLWASSQHFADPNLREPVLGVCQQYSNIVRTTMFFRAVLDAMDFWVTIGQAPPKSRIPTQSEGTLVCFEEWRTQFPGIPGVSLPIGPNELRPYNFGSDSNIGLLTYQPPKAISGKYTILVPAVDTDGNDVAGVRAPMVGAPLGTYTGWNLRGRTHGQGYMHEFTGSYIPFPESTEVKRATRDSRLSIKERYPDLESYLEAFRTTAEELLQEHLILEEDVDREILEIKNWKWLLNYCGL